MSDVIGKGNRTRYVIASLRDARILVLALLAAFVSGVAAIAVAWANMGPAQRTAFWPELAKAGMQALAVAVIGALVTGALNYTEAKREAALQDRDRAREEAEKDRDRQREDARHHNEYRLELLRRLREAYNEIKRVRRELQIAGFTPDATGDLPEASAAAYVAGIARLGEVKLELEAVRDELNAGVGGEGSTDVVLNHLLALEAYVDEFVAQEGRDVASVLFAHPGTMTFDHFGSIRDFTALAKYSFKENAADHYHAAVNALVADILRPPPSVAT